MAKCNPWITVMSLYVKPKSLGGWVDGFVLRMMATGEWCPTHVLPVRIHKKNMPFDDRPILYVTWPWLWHLHFMVKPSLIIFIPPSTTWLSQRNHQFMPRSEPRVWHPQSQNVLWFPLLSLGSISNLACECDFKGAGWTKSIDFTIVMGGSLLLYIYIYICMYICICIYVYVYVYYMYIY